MLKSHKILNIAVLAVTMMAFMPMTAALAKSDKAPNHVHKTLDSKDYKKNAARKGIDLNDRNIISRYLRSNYKDNCPPGLAKKNNGCLPPGQAKKYHIGGIFPKDQWGNVPRDLLDILSPAPRGHRYVQADRDVLLINEATKLVIDAVSAN